MADKRHPLPAFQVVPASHGQVEAAVHALAEGRGPQLPGRPLSRQDGVYGLAATAPFGMGGAPDLVHQPGGDLLNGIQHPLFKTLERQFRKPPVENFYGPVTPSRPISFELGAYEVPNQMTLWLTWFDFCVYRLSGVDPGDWLPAEVGRFSNKMGFDVTVSATRRAGDISYELDPVPGIAERPSFNRPVPQVPFGVGVGANQQQFVASVYNSFAATANPGTSLLPVRPGPYGPDGQPFTLVVGQGDRVALSCVVFRSLSTPIAFIQGRLAGFLLHTSVADALLDRMKPK